MGPLGNFELDLATPITNADGIILGYVLSSTDGAIRSFNDPNSESEEDEPLECEDLPTRDGEGALFDTLTDGMRFINGMARWRELEVSGASSTKIWVPRPYQFDSDSLGIDRVDIQDTIVEGFNTWNFANAAVTIEPSTSAGPCQLRKRDGVTCVRRRPLLGKLTWAHVRMNIGGFPRQSRRRWTDPVIFEHYVKDVDVEFTTKRNFSLLADAPLPGTHEGAEDPFKSLQDVAAHEYGHLLGLNHNKEMCNNDTIMWTTSQGQVARDFLRIETLYPHPTDQFFSIDWFCNILWREGACRE